LAAVGAASRLLTVAVVEPLTGTDALRTGSLGAPAAGQAVVRTSLVNRLCRSNGGTIATIIAPAGYGKTTLLAQWAERDSRQVLWVGLHAEDDDPEIVESRLAAVAGEPGLLAVVDNVHVLRSPAALEALEWLLGQTTEGTTVALAARRPPSLPLARLRVQGRLLEVGADELALTAREAETLLRRAGVLLPRHDAAALTERLEGWPAALFLAALSLRAGTQLAAISGDDWFLADYLETEHLAGLTSRQRRFATETAVLGQLTPEACDSLVDRSDSRQVLESLEGAGLLIPLDHGRGGYRYPRIVRDFLQAELERSDPERARVLHRAAADRAAELGTMEEALRHAAAAGDLGCVAEFAERIAVSASGRGRLDTLEPWLELLHDEALVESHSDLCMAASWLYALRGRATDAQHWADAAMRGLGGEDSRLNALKGLRCRDGADQMLEDANAACQTLAAGHPWRPGALLARGAALLLAGETARAEHELIEAVEIAAAAGATEIRVVGLCLLALLSIAEDERADA
jgi:LuxR family maltose regulon positive regulatory protein